MYNPTTRLLTILELLQARGSVTGSELAERLEVEDRSIRRYIMMLRDMGIPVEAERGRYGAYTLRPGFRLPPLMFNDDEILAVVLGLMLGRKLALTDSQGVESALAKIERVLPAELRQRVWALQNSLTLNLVSDDRTPRSEFVQVLSLASYEQKSVFMRYGAYGGNVTERLFDPYGLVYHAGLWYTSGYCHLRQDLRTFRLDRIESIDHRDQSFDRPADFNVLDFVLKSIATIPGAWLVEVILKTSLEEAQQLVPADMATLDVTEAGILMRCYAGNLPWMARFLVNTGVAFVILQPDDLRMAIRTLAENMLRLVDQP
jgi:predicted DNA-binding transcriptional regulator YafY